MVVAACTIFIPPFWPGWAFLCAVTLYYVRICKVTGSENQEYERYRQATHAEDKRGADYEDDEEVNYSEHTWHSDEEFEYKMSTMHKMMAVVAGIVMAFTLDDSTKIYQHNHQKSALELIVSKCIWR